MCTLGVIPHHFLFKTRDLWQNSGHKEVVVERDDCFRYIGVQGHAHPNEIGLNSGINNAGLAVAITFVDRVTLEDALTSKTPRGVLVEDILGHCGTMVEAVQRFISYWNSPLVGGNIVIATPEGGVTIEQLHPLSALEWHCEHPVVRTNHFVNLNADIHVLNELQDTFDWYQRNSRDRYRRTEELLGEGVFDVSSIRMLLSDHEGDHPICSHSGNLVTRSAAIYDLERLELHYHSGSPCNNKWKTFTLS